MAQVENLYSELTRLPCRAPWLEYLRANSLSFLAGAIHTGANILELEQSGRVTGRYRFSMRRRKIQNSLIGPYSRVQHNAVHDD